jgi:SAM-dependent methyltransferase
MPTRFEQFYIDSYADSEFRQTYLTGRHRTYRRVARILRRLGVRWALDVGCAYGLLVEELNGSGIDAYGVDLPVARLQEFHASLKHSAGNFLYGDAATMTFSIPADDSAITILDSLRYFDVVQPLTRQDAQYIIAKETGSRSYIVGQRKPEDQVRFYSPLDLLETFDRYVPWEIHASRYLFHIDKPGATTLRLFDRLPNYTLVLKRRA